MGKEKGGHTSRSSIKMGGISGKKAGGISINTGQNWEGRGPVDYRDKPEGQECGKKVLGIHQCTREKTEGYQQTLTTQEGTKVEGEEAREYIRHTIEAAFSELESDQAVGNGSVYTTQEEDHSEEEEMTTGEWEKAEGRVPAGTATGPDGIPMRLIKSSRPNKQIETKAGD